MTEDNNCVGLANCLRLHIYAEPDETSDVVCKIRYLTDVVIDSRNSTKDFYKICTAVGAEGFCRKELITIK